MVLGLAKALVSLPVVWAWATHFSFPRKILRVLCGYFEHQRRAQFEGCAAERLTTITALLLGFKWICLLLRIVLQDALSEVTNIYTTLKLRVFVDDITALVTGKNQEVAEIFVERMAEASWMFEPLIIVSGDRVKTTCTSDTVVQLLLGTPPRDNTALEIQRHDQSKKSLDYNAQIIHFRCHFAP